MLAAIARALTLFAALQLDFRVGAVAHVGLLAADEFLSKLVQALEVIARVCDFCGREAEPCDYLFGRCDVYLLFGLRVRVVEAQVALPAVEARKAEIYSYSLCVAYLKW